MSRPEPSTRARGAGAASFRRAPFGVTPDGCAVDAFTLTNARGTELRFMAYGGIVLSLRLPDRHGVLADVTLGYDSLDAYLGDRRYFGALIGRYANRIAGGRFAIDGVEYAVTRNEGENHLHGGRRGFHRVVWSVEERRTDEGASAVLRYTSPDGEEGYPGTLETRVTYTLTDRDEVAIDFRAVTDRATPVSLTHHAYFNLAGHDAGDVLSHELTVHASRFTPVDAGKIPTGELRAVAGTPFDFGTPTAIGARIDADDEQLRVAGGYDHNFVLDRPADAAPTLAARLREPRSGRWLELLTTEPGLQLYSGNVLDSGAEGKGGHAYARRAGLALEPQHFPDSPNHAAFPSTILRPGDVYRSTTIYRFGADDARQSSPS